MSTNNTTTTIELDEGYVVHGNSDYLMEYEKTKIFQAADKIAVGINNSEVHCYTDALSGGDSGDVVGIKAIQLPDSENNGAITPKNNALKSVPLGETTGSTIGYDVVQNPLASSAECHVAVYKAPLDKKQSVYFFNDPLGSGSQSPKEITFDNSSSSNGLFSTYYKGPVAVQDQLGTSLQAAINISWIDGSGNTHLEAISNNYFSAQAADFPLATKVLDFKGIYRKDDDSFFMAFVLAMVNGNGGSMNNFLLVAALDARSNSLVYDVVATGNLGLNPTCLSVFESLGETSSLYFAGIPTGKTSGYDCYELLPIYSPGEQTVNFNTNLVLSNTYGNLEKFNIGPAEGGMEFWGQVNYNTQEDPLKLLVSSSTPDDNVSSDNWSTVSPVLPMSGYSYYYEGGFGGLIVQAADPAALKDNDLIGSSLVAVASAKNQLLQVWSTQQNKKRVIKSSPVKLPSTTTVKYSVSATYLNFLDSTGAPLQKQSISLSTSERTYAEVNGQLIHFAPGKSQTVTTNEYGRVVIARHSTTFDTEIFTATFGNYGSFHVNTTANGQKNLGTNSKSSGSSTLQNVGPKLSSLAKSKNKGQDIPVLSPVSAPPVGGADNASMPATYTAISFNNGTSTVFDNATAFQTHLSQNPPNAELGGFLDDLWHDFTSAWDDLEKDASAFLAAAENFVSKVTAIVVDGVEMAIHFADQIAKIALDTLDDIWKAIKYVVNKLVTAVEDLIKLIGAFFEILAHIGHTTKGISTMISSSFDKLTSEFTNKDSELRTAFDGFFKSLENDLGGLQGGGAEKQQSNSGKAHSTFLGSTPVNWVLSHIASLFETKNTDDPFVFANLTDDLIKFFVDLVVTLEDAVGGLFAAVTDLPDFHQKLEQGITQVKHDLVQDVADLDNVMGDVLDFIGANLSTLEGLLKKGIDIPILSDIFDDLLNDGKETGPFELNLLNFMSFVVAIPTTVLTVVLSDIFSSKTYYPFGNIESFDDLTTYEDLAKAMGLPASFSFQSGQQAEQALGTTGTEVTKVSKAVIDTIGLSSGLINFILTSPFKLNKFATKDDEVPKTPPWQQAFKLINLSTTILSRIGGYVLGDYKTNPDLYNLQTYLGVAGKIIPFILVDDPKISYETKARQKELSNGSGKANLYFQGLFAMAALGGFAFVKKNSLSTTLGIVQPSIFFASNVALEKEGSFKAGLFLGLAGYGISTIDVIQEWDGL